MRLLIVACAVALACTATAVGASLQPPAAPPGLHALVYRADEPVKADHTYALMPAFAWKAVDGASNYELQLATSRTFSDATTLYDKSFGAPVASIQLQVPWMTGKPYALWARVRVVANGQTSRWGAPFGFNTAWQAIPQRQDAPDGLIRWSPVEGATGYEVWFMNVPGNYQTHFRTLTNVADEREYWTFHPAGAKTIRWRVRAIRLVTSGSLPNGIRAVNYGPYSQPFTTTTSAALSANKIQGTGALSNVESTPKAAKPHQLTPGVAWSGTRDYAGIGAGSELWRAYVFSDRQCINPVMTGSLIGGPAWAPREGDPLKMPGTDEELNEFRNGKFPGFGPQDNVYAADGSTPSASESPGTTAGSGGTTPASDGGATPTPTGANPTTATPGLISLPDNGWPQGRYWWTVVPVRIQWSDSTSPKLEFHDMTLPQDACAAGRVWTFGMQSSPVTTTSQTPYASGVVAGNRVLSAVKQRPAFRELPVVTWVPSLAADTYEIELSRHVYPWKPVKKVTSVVTSAVLPLSKKADRGVWYYRVRGVNPNLTGPGQKLAWSKPVAVKITGDVFVVVK